MVTLDLESLFDAYYITKALELLSYNYWPLHVNTPLNYFFELFPEWKTLVAEDIDGLLLRRRLLHDHGREQAGSHRSQIPLLSGNEN